MVKYVKSLSSPVLLNVIIFGIVGVVGFVFDAGVLYALKGQIGVYPAKLVSFVVAVVVTWLLNRWITFRRSRSGMRLWREFTQYFVLMIAGGTVNYLAFWISTRYSPTIMAFPVIGVAIGSLCGMVFNYTSAKLFVFKKTLS
ncbi:GtrA family protein [Acerihabitans sp. TG2]|uniref:GtrA family protein n=1 Tax=Acerihabitans sp. TG2 TaxID=3096008 RepID=UPI002B221D9F|nr:GtrA family protein [Acerihabitans sp. TG2]MEA9393432.1 GtrA family protein [Acerihabitans sp. TG2]